LPSEVLPLFARISNRWQRNARLDAKGSMEAASYSEVVPGTRLPRQLFSDFRKLVPPDHDGQLFSESLRAALSRCHRPRRGQWAQLTEQPGRSVYIAFESGR